MGDEMDASIHRTGVAMRHTGIGRPAEKGAGYVYLNDGFWSTPAICIFKNRVYRIAAIQTQTGSS
jgi:hypothetical protein